MIKIEIIFLSSIFPNISLISKQKAYRDVSREIQDLRCQEAKVHVQHQMLDVKLSMMEDENELVDGIDLGEPQMSTLSRRAPSVSQVRDWSQFLFVFFRMHQVCIQLGKCIYNNS